MTNAFEDMNKVGQEAMDNSLKAVSTLATGLQSLAGEAAKFSKDSYDQGTKAVEQLVAVKSLENAFEVQSAYAKSAFEAFVAQSTKMSEMMVAMTKDVYKPMETVLTSAK